MTCWHSRGSRAPCRFLPLPPADTPALVIALSIACLAGGVVVADEREITPEQQAAVNGDGQPPPPPRPAKLPDFTKGDPVPDKPPVWMLGPSGIVGVWAGGFAGDQFLVQQVLPGSPAEGKILPGDVLRGVGGEPFAAGGHMGVLVGDAIIEAEKEANGGKLTLTVWRDRNYAKRNAGLDADSVDIEQVFEEAAEGDALYDWKPADVQATETKRQQFDAFPIDATTLEIDLTLRTFPDYADTAPFDCPKTSRILEDAWGVLEKKFIKDPSDPRSGRGGYLEALALVASGKPEHRKLVREWVRGPHAKAWHPSVAGSIDMMKPRGYFSWYCGFVGLTCGLYYDATGDEFVLPALQEYAVKTAMGQSAGGTWGHTFAWPTFNGGKLHGMNPGYGALNCAGNRCFFLIVLAKHLGIEHPEIDAAIERSRRFFGSFVDQGCIPYGDHAAYPSDDSNGKNTGVAYAMKLLGDDHAAKYFALMSTHASFTRRGGHGHDYHGNWSGWAATLCGPEVRALAERNMRWRRTLCRRYDGSFVYHSPTYNTLSSPLRDPTATEVLHQAVALGQTMITGKDPDPSLHPTPREMSQLLTSARPQFNDPWLDAKAGTPWQERSTTEILDLLDIFYPKARRNVAVELGRRFQAGEREIPESLLDLLKHDSPRFRDGGLRGLLACGPDTVLANLSRITPLLADPHDFVRITAVGVVSRAADEAQAQEALLAATVAPPQAVAPNSVRNATQTPLFGGDTPLATTPFAAGYDESLVRDALENVLTLDPTGRSFLGSRVKIWDKDTAVRLAGPLVYIAEEEQINDRMFASRSPAAQALLQRLGYREGFTSTAFRVAEQAALPRHLRPVVTVLHPRRPLFDAKAMKKNPGAFGDFRVPLETLVIDDPLASIHEYVGKDKVIVPLEKLLKLVEAASPVSLPSIADDVSRLFQSRLTAAGGPAEQLRLCRDTLADDGRRTSFRKLAAIDFLVEQLGPAALDDLLPLLAHADRRVRARAREQAARLASADGGTALAAKDADAADPAVRAGMIAVLGTARATAGLPLAKAALDDPDPEVRAAAIVATAAIAGADSVPEVLACYGRAVEPTDLRACEEALLPLLTDSAVAPRIRDALLAALPEATGPRRESLFWLLGQCGDAKSLAALEQAGATKVADEFRALVTALSYSPAIEADAVMLRLAKSDKSKAPIVASRAIRRMVLGPKGYGDRTDAQRLALAGPILALAGDDRLVTYLGRLAIPGAMPLLVDQLRKGRRSAAESVVTGAEGMENLSPADAAIVAGALRDVMEYLEVAYLRGGPEGKDFREYPAAKALQARAGQALVKVHKPEAAPITGFNDLDLDL